MHKILILIILLLSSINAKVSINHNNIQLTKEEMNYINTKKRVYIGNRDDWVPFDFNKNNTAQGFGIDYIKLLLNKLGLEPIFVKEDIKNLNRMLLDGDVDILPAMYENKKNEDFIYTNSYFKEEFLLIINKNNYTINTLQDLGNKRIGILKDSSSIEFYKKELSENTRIIEFYSLEDIFDALASGFIDATIQNKLTANYYINNNYENDLKILDSIFLSKYNKSISIALKKESTILCDLFNKAIQRTSKQEIEKLESRWMPLSTRVSLSKEEIEFIRNNKIKIAYTNNYAPFSFDDKNKAKGLGFDFWEFIASINGINYETELKKDFNEALESIKNKKNDIIITTSKTPQRERYSIFSNAYYQAPIGIATRNNIDYIVNIEKLKNKKIAIGKNHTAHALLKAKYPDLKFVFIDNLVDGLKKLSNNEVYAVAELMPVLTHNLNKYGYTDLKISGNANVDFKLKMMIRDDYKPLQSIINKTLLSMTVEEKNSIYTKWSNIKYITPFDYSIFWKFLLPLFLIIGIIAYKNRQLVKYQKSLNATKEELENSLNTFKNLVDMTIESIIIVQKSKIVFTNNEMHKMFEIKEDEINHLELKNIFHKESKETIEKIIKRNDSKTYELLGVKNQNKTFPCIVKSKKTIFKNVDSYIISIIDISELKEKESILVNQSKLASMGEMIGNIAHQWRQPLSIISTSASGLVLQKEFGQLDDKTLIDALNNINETTKFLSQTIDDFQDYLNKDKSKSEFTIYSNIQKVLNILRSSFTIHEITILENLDEYCKVYTYENELKQVILNILNNSKDALKNIENHKRYIEINTLVSDNITYLEFIDNGGGIPQDIIDKVFEPYFTTKHKKQGTGLGLYMTHKIITESMGGEIHIENCEHIFENTKFDKCTKVSIKLTNS